MARVTLTPTAQVAITSNGLNITDTAFITLATGANNGVEFTYDGNDLIFLKNTTAGAAVYTLVLNAPTSITAVGGAVTNTTVTVAAGKTHVFRLTDIFKQVADSNKAYIDCDIAGDVMVLNL